MLKVFGCVVLVVFGWCGHVWYTAHRAELPSVSVHVDPGSLVSWPRTVHPPLATSAPTKPQGNPIPRQNVAPEPRAEAPIYWAPGMPYLSPPI